MKTVEFLNSVINKTLGSLNNILTFVNNMAGAIIRVKGVKALEWWKLGLNIIFSSWNYTGLYFTCPQTGCHVIYVLWWECIVNISCWYRLFAVNCMKSYSWCLFLHHYSVFIYVSLGLFVIFTQIVLVNDHTPFFYYYFYWQLKVN